MSARTRISDDGSAAGQRVTRHFATVRGRRQVHYRREGTGSPVLLLHQSPASSRDCLELMAEIAKLGYTVIAPDTPGNGLSDPLPDLDLPEMEDFATAVSEFMTELGIERAPVYGFHTGGGCALALGLRHPERVTLTITDGYVQLEPAERQEILARYLPPFAYDWSGSHLTWAWARMREQLIFFPWYRKDTARRLDYDLPAPTVLHGWLMDFFRAGDNYRKAYRAAFTFDCARAVQDTKAKAVITTARTDVLSPCMDLMPTLPPNVTAWRPATDIDTRRQVIQALTENPSPQKSLAMTGAKAVPGHIWSDYLQTPDASIYCRRSTAGQGRAIVMIHASAASSMAMDRFMRPLIGKRPLLAVDLPGNGESDNPLGANVNVEAQARYLGLAIEAAGYHEVDVFGHWGGGCVGVELALQRPKLVKHLALPTPVVLDDTTREEYLANYCPSIEIDEHGAHLLKAWNMLRDQELFQPWYKHTREHIRRDAEPDIAPDVIQRRTLDLFKCLDIYQVAYRAHFRYPLLEKLKQVTCPVLFGAPEAIATQRAMAATRNSTAQPISAEFTAAAGTLLAFFDGHAAAACVGSQ